MEFQQLEMFAAVVEEGNVRRASKRVYRTGPAVSIALRKLEEEVGAPLFNRSDRNSNDLTAAGTLLYSYATRILSLRREAISGLQDLTECRTGIVRIGANESTSLYLLPKLTHALQEAHPALKIEARCDNSEIIIAALKDGRIDLALVALTGDEPELKKHLIMRDEIVLIANPRHRLADRAQIELSDLAEEVLIAEGSKSSLYEEVLNAFRKSGTQFDVSVANVSIEGIKRMVTEGIGVGFVPLMCVQEEETRGELATIRVEGVSRSRELWLVQRESDSLSSAAEAFLKVSLKLAEAWTGAQTDTNERQLARANSTQVFPQRIPLSRARSYC
jgi:DNA-binding transcriptional LysR family regulator